MSDSSFEWDSEIEWQMYNVYGRTFQARVYSDVLLPVDEMERERQNTQHEALTLGIGSLYGPVAEVKDRLRSREGRAPRVVDLGCGNGLWAIEMAEEFPHAEVLGIDLAPIVIPQQYIGNQPVNSKFEIDDVNLSLSHHAGCFDVAHARSLDGFITNYAAFLYKVAQILRPGGWFLTVKGDLHLYDSSRRRMPEMVEGTPGFSYAQFLFQASYNATKKRTYSEDASMWYRELFTENPNFDPNTIVVKTLHIPVSPWPSRMSPRDQRLCQLMRSDFVRVFKSWEPLLRQHHHHEDVDRWIAAATDELNNLTLHAYSKWTFAWVRRSRDPWQAPPPDIRSQYLDNPGVRSP